MSISIIHLTDIHMVSDAVKNTILSRKQQLYNACYSVLSPEDSAVIIISGDIASSGKVKEYENAFELIDFLQQELSQYLLCDLKVLMVPGNHDCDFETKYPLRERLLSTFDASLNIDLELLSSVTCVQNSFFEFSELFSKYDPNSLCNLYEITCGTNKLLFQMVNSAWMSQKQEQPGKIIIPQNGFKNIDADNYDCVFTVMHHPYNWLHPDNCTEFLHYIRQTTDVLLIGHEHQKDSFTSKGEKWLITEFHGKELQNASDTDSAFSIYQFDEGFQNITTYDFFWRDGLYRTANTCSNMFMRNTLTASLMLVPSKVYINEYVDDPGMIIVHENADTIRLSEIYCWPDLEQIEIHDATTITQVKKITSDVPMQLLKSSISVIVGDSLSGKTSLAKMLFRDYAQGEKCCLLLKGDELNTIVPTNLRERINAIFINEYSADSVERFRQLPPEKRIIIVDDFNNVPYHDERRSNILSFLGQFASNVIIFTDNELETRLICSKLTTPESIDVNYYRVCNFGNTKRYEFIKNWYCIGDEYANGDIEVESRIKNSFERINALLGGSRGFIPATPIYLINLLQNIDSAMPTSFSGSQYGFLYDSLINKSMSAIKYKNSGALNIDINIMSMLAFHMLRAKNNTFSKTDFLQISSKFSDQKKVSVNPEALISNMITSRLIQEIGPNANIFKFRYPYVFYYFSGRYIAYNLSVPEVSEEIDYMSQRLYNEKYGNIIIFVCHFANSIKIIENILLIAYSSLEQYDMFDFDKHKDIFERATDIMDSILTKSVVGTENDVNDHCKSKLIAKDKMGLQDGSVHEPTEITDEIVEKEKDLASLSAAMRTLDVLGQIIMNYPGDIDGDVKILIIDEIHKLGMRITEAMLSTLRLLERDFVEYVVGYVKNEKRYSDDREIIQASQTLFYWIVAGMTCGMIHKISRSLYNDALLVAVQETFSVSSSLSQKLILADLQFNVLKKPNISEVIKLSSEFKEGKSTQFAGTVLRSIVSDYLRHNKCGHNMRAQLCSHFGLSDKRALIEGSKNRDL